MILKNKTAIITGGGGGIGSAIAKTFAENGCNIVLVSVRKKTLKKVERELVKYGVRVLAAACDVSNYKSVERVFKNIIATFKKIDILVNAAGVYGPIGPFESADMEKWAEAININLLGTVFCVRVAAPFMIANKRGKIINFSGGGAFNAFPRFSAYATSKAATVRFTEIMAEELKPYNIQINAISPGAVNTKLLEDALRAGPKSTGREMHEKLKKQKKEGGDSPQLAADLALFLASDSSFRLTGKAISAKWDDWRNLTERKISEINFSSTYTLRRIDDKYFKEIT